MRRTNDAKDYLGVRKALAGQSLGELEAQILDIAWDLEPPISTAQVFRIMYPRRELSYSTIMLTMGKLTRKGILNRRRLGDKKTDPFSYWPSVSRQELGFTLLNQISLLLLRNPLDKAIMELCGAEHASSVDLKKLTHIIGG